MLIPTNEHGSDSMTLLCVIFWNTFDSLYTVFACISKVMLKRHLVLLYIPFLYIPFLYVSFLYILFSVHSTSVHTIVLCTTLV